MVLANSDNLFGISDFIVDPTGVSGSFTTINAALVAASVIAGGTVFVRYTGTPYVEDILWPEKCDIVGIGGDGRLGQVVIEGKVSITSLGEHTALNIQFQNSADTDPVFTLAPVGVTTVVALENCVVKSPGGGPLILMNPTVGGIVAMVASQTDFPASSDTQFILAGQSFLKLQICQADTSVGSNVYLTDTAQFEADNSNFDSQLDNIVLDSDTCNVNIGHGCVFTTDTNGSVFAFGGHTPSADIVGCVIACHEASNYWVKGAGTVNYSNLTFQTSSNLIDPGVTANVFDWQPYATATTVGTAKFDSSDFNVSSSGLVTLVAPAAITWTDHAAPTTVSAFSGSFISAAVTLTLPVAAQGDVCQFVCTSSGPCGIQAQGGDKIFIGSSASSAGGTMTNTAIGDSLYLVYQVASSGWYSVGSPAGLWVPA